MDEDFNTPAGFGALFEMLREANTLLRSESGMDEESRSALVTFLRRVGVDLFGVLDEEKADAAGSEALAGVMQLLIDLRAEARKDKQFALSDRIRDGLKELGIVLEDSRDGTIWKFIS
jgi:cysteinyl-tRNA synthetase